MPDEVFPLVSICVPTHDRSALLAECLGSLAGQTYPARSVEVLVFDDASSPGEAEKTKAAVDSLKDKGFLRARLIRSERNVFALAGRQRLFDASDKEAAFVLFLDDDCELEKETLKRLVRTALDRPEAGALGPRIVGGSGAVLHAALFVDPWTGRYRTEDPDEPASCDWLDPACLLMPRETYRLTGGFDRSFVRSHEGADLCLRVKAGGLVVLYEPRARAVHKRAPFEEKRGRLYYLYRNKFWVLKKNFRGPRRTVALSVHAVLGTPSYFRESFLHHGRIDRAEWRDIAAAVRDGLFNGPDEGTVS